MNIEWEEVFTATLTRLELFVIEEALVEYTNLRMDAEYSKVYATAEGMREKINRALGEEGK